MYGLIQDENKDLAPAAAGDMIDLEKNMATLVCSINNKDDCVMCGS